jgi:MFS family permease
MVLIHKVWGNISIYATSYFRLHGYPDLKNTTMQAVFPFIYVGIVVGQFVGLACARKFGHKLFSAINMLVYGASLYLASVTNFYAFLIFMGFLPGLCIGCENFVPVDNAYYFYPDRKVTMSLIVGCCWGLDIVWDRIWSCCVESAFLAPDQP